MNAFQQDALGLSPFCIHHPIIMESHFAYKRFCPAVTFHFAYFLMRVKLMAENDCPCQKKSELIIKNCSKHPNL